MNGNFCGAHFTLFSYHRRGIYRAIKTAKFIRRLHKFTQIFTATKTDLGLALNRCKFA